jgi:hypothetical protein
MGLNVQKSTFRVLSEVVDLVMLMPLRCIQYSRKQLSPSTEIGWRARKGGHVDPSSSEKNEKEEEEKN